MTTDNKNLALETQQGTLCHMLLFFLSGLYLYISVLKICVIVLLSRKCMAAVL